MFNDRGDEENFIHFDSSLIPAKTFKTDKILIKESTKA